MKKTMFICVLALCLPLFGCGQREESEIPGAEQEGEGAFSMVALPVHEEVRFDLDGDGGEDTVMYSLLDDEGLSFRLEANGTAVDEDGVYPADTAYIIDLDGSDAYHEVAVSETGMSDDYMVHIFRYDGENWLKLGYIPGFISSEENLSQTTLRGNGFIDTLRRGEVVSTWFFVAHYRLENAVLVWQEEEAYDMKAPVTLLVDLPLSSGPAAEDTVATLAAGSETEIFQTDNFSWISFVLDDGSTAYARLGADGFSLAALDLPTYEVFEGLIFAD